MYIWEDNQEIFLLQSRMEEQSTPPPPIMDNRSKKASSRTRRNATVSRNICGHQLLITCDDSPTVSCGGNKQSFNKIYFTDNFVRIRRLSMGGYLNGRFTRDQPKKKSQNQSKQIKSAEQCKNSIGTSQQADKTLRRYKSGVLQ